MDKRQILARVTPLFIKNGYRGFKMDQVVNELEVSKSTLYKIFPNKEELIKSVLDYEIEFLKRIVEKAKRKKDFFENIKYLRKKSTKFVEPPSKSRNFHELEKYYPQLYGYHINQFFTLIHQIVHDLALRGRKEGYVKEHLNLKTTALIFSNNYQEIILRKHKNPIIIKSSVENYVNLFLQGILTQKGFDKLHAIKGEKKSNLDMKQLLEFVTPIFVREGYREFKIDNLISELSISKKTLYNLIGDKKNLINEVLKYEIERMNKIVEEGRKLKNFFLNMSFVLNEIFTLEPPKIQNRNFQQLKKYYPEQYEAQVERTESFIYQFTYELLTRGVDEDYVQNKLDIDILASMFANNYSAMITKAYNEEGKIDVYVNSFINFMIQGTLTQKGFSYIQNNSWVM